ncbi:MAG TPA: Ser-Thr-rich GPI-anchored membrane family protein [Candidatus Lokiarchaeia archaeon]|nr:Ser-Thr-rich GPI-anchored membrane family protein [Candidatus Lokiarchaeia archaeon]
MMNGKPKSCITTVLFLLFIGACTVASMWCTNSLSYKKEASQSSANISSLVVMQGSDIVVTSPTKSSVWLVGSTVNITWTYIGPYSNPFIIALLNTDYSVNRVIVINTTTHGSYDWTIPPGVAMGYYTISVEDGYFPTLYRGASSQFFIMPPLIIVVIVFIVILGVAIIGVAVIEGKKSRAKKASYS